MHPYVIAGITGAKVVATGVATGAKAFHSGMGTVNNWLKQTMPINDPSTMESGKVEFTPLSSKFSEDPNYKGMVDNIKLLEDTSALLDDGAARRLTEKVIDLFNTEALKLVFAGQFNKGKSALLNKLLNRKILESDHGETTRTLVWLFPGETGKEKAWYHDTEDTRHEISLDEIKGISNGEQVQNVFACVNADILSHGAWLIDTPGLEKSKETEAITMDMLEIADAAILVIDDNSPETHDERFIEKLRKEGKGDRLFVVMNKMDYKTEDEKKLLVQDRLEWLSKLGIQTRIYPLSNTDKIDDRDADFELFLKDLTNYIKIGLPKAREANVGQQIKNAADWLSKSLKEAAMLSKLNDEKERDKKKEEAQAELNRIKQGLDKGILAGKKNIEGLRTAVLGDWNVYFGKLKDDINYQIQKASDAELNSVQQYLGTIQATVNQFLSDEFYKAQQQFNEISKSVARDLDNIQLPVVLREGRTDLSVSNWSKNIKISPEMGTYGLMAYTFLTRTPTFFGTIAVIPQLYLLMMLSPFINKIFEQVLVMVGKGGTALQKTKLQEKVNSEVLPAIDTNARKSINDYFDDMAKTLDRSGKQTFDEFASPLQTTIGMIDTFTTGDKTSELEKMQRRMGTIV